jgi:hypothetical protein
VIHKQWACQHSKRNKTASSNRSTDSQATIDILIKKNTVHTRRTDSFLRQSPPLCAVITAKLGHNHSLGSSGSLKYLRVSDDIKSTFVKYFSDGLAPAEAMRAHENVLMMEPNATEALADGSRNPIQRAVYYLHSQWKVTNFGGTAAPLVKLKENIKTYAEQGKC